MLNKVKSKLSIINILTLHKNKFKLINLNLMMNIILMYHKFLIEQLLKEFVQDLVKVTYHKKLLNNKT